MICPVCATSYHPQCWIAGCQVAYLVGSSAGEHCMSHYNYGLFVGSTPDLYLPWEAPAEHCPICWHRNNVGRRRTPELQAWVKSRLVNADGQTVDSPPKYIPLKKSLYPQKRDLSYTISPKTGIMAPKYVQYEILYIFYAIRIPLDYGPQFV